MKSMFGLKSICKIFVLVPVVKIFIVFNQNITKQIWMEYSSIKLKHCTDSAGTVSGVSRDPAALARGPHCRSIQYKVIVLMPQAKAT